MLGHGQKTKRINEHTETELFLMAEKNDGFCIKVTAPPFRASIKSPKVSVSLRSLANSRIPTNKMIW